MSLLSHHPYGRSLTREDIEAKRERVLSAFVERPSDDDIPPPIQLPPKETDSMSPDDKNLAQNIGCAALLIIGLILFIILCMWGLPLYNVWKSELQGKAELVRAEQNRQIKIEEAKANLEAEKLNAEAEVERAKGAAKAIEIENGKLTDTYIKYLAVRTFNTDNAKFVYIPTECGIVPYLLEAGRGPKVEFPTAQVHPAVKEEE